MMRTFATVIAIAFAAVEFEKWIRFGRGRGENAFLN